MRQKVFLAEESPELEEEESAKFDADFSFDLDNKPASIPEPQRQNRTGRLQEEIQKIASEKYVKVETSKSKRGKDTVREENRVEADEEGEDDEDFQSVIMENDAVEGYFDDSVSVDSSIQIGSFSELRLSRAILKGLSAMKFEKPTPIQAAAIPLALRGKDICGSAVTGSGKTAAFLIPAFERLMHRSKHEAASIKVLVILPTRELAVQCHEVALGISKFTDVSVTMVAGGLPMKPEELALRRRPDVLVATPGRLIDHLNNTPNFSLDSIEILVLDEADRMLEDSFADELNEIIKFCPRERQTMLFSASMTDDVSELIKLSLQHPARLFVDSNTAIAQKLFQEFVRIRANKDDDRLPIVLALCKRTYKRRCIVFFPTKELTHRGRIVLGLAGLKVAELHGGLNQVDRLEALQMFKDGKVDFMVATDVASRGLDISGVQSVINYNMPITYKQYLHRVGRTARAGQSGRSVTLVGEGADRKLLKMVIKNSTEAVKHRLIAPEVIAEYRRMVDEMAEDIHFILKFEKEEKMLEQTEKQIKRAENLIDHQMEIHSRPAKQWFQTERDKKRTKRDAKNALFENGPGDYVKKVAGKAGKKGHKPNRGRRS